MSNTIFFVTSPIPTALCILLDQDKPLPSIESLLPTILVTSSGPNWDWTIQTFLHMRQAGLDVALVEQPVKGAICVTHFDTLKNKLWAPYSFVVGIRADRSPLRMCEVEIVQSPANLSTGNSFFMPFWPQSRVLCRDEARGNLIKRMSYFGGSGGLSPEFNSPSFLKMLDDLGIEFCTSGNPKDWGDYQETDLILAVRHHIHPRLLATKPASKLVNAWQAGCVALLGREPAYRVVGRPGQDYFEVNRPKEVIEVIANFKKHPELYQRVRQAGIKRYAEYSFEAVQQRWVDLLTGPILQAFEQWQQDMYPYPNKCLSHRLWQSSRQWLEHKSFYTPVRVHGLLNSDKQYPIFPFKKA